MIPPKKNRTQMREYDRHLYRERHLVECFIGKIKQYRRVFSRFEKTVKELFGLLEFRQRTHLAALTMSTEPSNAVFDLALGLRKCHQACAVSRVTQADAPPC